MKCIFETVLIHLKTSDAVCVLSALVSVRLCFGLNLSSILAIILYAADGGTLKPYFC